MNSGAENIETALKNAILSKRLYFEAAKKIDGLAVELGDAKSMAKFLQEHLSPKRS